MPIDLETLAPGPFALKNVHVHWHPEGIVLGPAAQQYLDDRWAYYESAAKAAGKSLFNAPITRLIQAEAANGPLHLHVGPADYKTFVVATLRDRPWFLEHSPEAVVGALGNSVLLTSGDQALLGIRSQIVSAYPGRAHLFGGVLGALNPANPTAGLLEHLKLELFEELGLEAGKLKGEPRVLGVFRDLHLAQPEVVWQWELGVSMEEVAKGVRKAEHDAVVVLERGSSMAAACGEFLPTPNAQAAFELWQIIPTK